MVVRRRLLPTAIVGGVLAAGMTLGVGSAEAAATCSGYTIVNDALITSNEAGECVAVLSLPAYDVSKGAVLTTDQLLAAVKAGVLKSVAPTSIVVPPLTSTAASVPASKPVPASTTTPATTTPAPQAGAAPLVPPAAVAPPAPVPAAAAAVGAAPDPALLAPGYSPALLASGTYDPSLLLGAPGVSPMLGVVSATDPASAVTTASQVQAMALSAPGALGLPAVAGVIILAGLGGVAVRYRLRRAGGKVPTSS